MRSTSVDIAICLVYIYINSGDSRKYVYLAFREKFVSMRLLERLLRRAVCYRNIKFSLINIVLFSEFYVVVFTESLSIVLAKIGICTQKLHFSH